MKVISYRFKSKRKRRALAKGVASFLMSVKNKTEIMIKE